MDLIHLCCSKVQAWIKATEKMALSPGLSQGTLNTCKLVLAKGQTTSESLAQTADVRSAIETDYSVVEKNLIMIINWAVLLAIFFNYFLMYISVSCLLFLCTRL